MGKVHVVVQGLGLYGMCVWKRYGCGCVCGF